MSVSSEGARTPAPGVRPAGPKAAFAGRIARVYGADGALGRAIAVELAGRGAEVWALGSDERKLGEAVGEIAYQGGWGRHLVLPGALWSDVSSGSLALPEALVAPADVVVAALPPGTEALPAAAWEAWCQRLTPALVPGGALLFAAIGAPDAEIAPWLRRAARIAARSDRPVLLNVVALGSPDGDADGAARVAALLCSADASGLSGQLVVVASA